MLVNTIVSYSRTVVSAILILFSNRWVLAALGFSDYGIYQLVGSLIVIVTFLNAVLSGGASRFFSFAMGESEEEVNNWFNVSLLVHLFLFL